MRSLNFVVLGDGSVAGELAKKGAVSDMTMYERKSSDSIMSFIVPTSFPEKIQPLIQAIALAEYSIINVKSIDRALGEQIVALDAMKMTSGFIVHNGLEEDVKKIATSTVVENYKFVNLDELKVEIEKLAEVSSGGLVKLVIDSSFDVKGVGAVALGVVRRGELKKHDELVLFPLGKPLSIRSVQMHDGDVDSAKSPGRVGVAVRGIEAKEISRGDIMAPAGSIKHSSSFKIDFKKNKFYKSEISSSSSYHLCIGLQVRPVKISVENNVFSVTSEKPFAFENGENCVVLDLNSSSVRIVGNGTLVG